MTELDFHDRYEFVQRWLQRRRAYVAAAIIRLGQVHITDQLPTAAIVARGPEVRLYFNPEFLASIDNREFAGVLTHEALHFFLRHQQRLQAIRTQRDKFYFSLACEAVINDSITASFSEMKLPGKPVTGGALVGQDTSKMSAEQVFQLLCQQRLEDGGALDERLGDFEPTDDHSLWESENENTGNHQPASGDFSGASSSAQSQLLVGEWTEETSELAAEVLEDIPDGDPCYGTLAAGKERLATATGKCRKDMAQFLTDAASFPAGYDTLWTVPNRKLSGIYPKILLPTYEPQSWWNILVAIDTSGSVPASFVSVAMTFARQRLPRTRLTLVSFDAECYEAALDSCTLKGGGGTRAQAVEEFIQKRHQPYPDVVFLLTDGWTPPPSPRHPDRWIWLLPPWGSTHSVPKGSRSEFFEVSETGGRESTPPP